MAEVFAGIAVEVIIFGLAGGLLYRVWHKAAFLPQRKTLLPFNKGVLLEGERVVKVVERGSHWIGPKQALVPVDVRSRPFQVPARELLSSDAQGVRVRLSGEYQVVDPVPFVCASRDAHASFYLEVERVVSLAVAEFDRDSLLKNQAALTDRIRERVEPRASALGIEMIQLTVADMIPIAWTQEQYRG